MTSAYAILKYPGHLVPAAYLNYIKARWMRSYRQGNHFIKLIDSESYFYAYDIYTSRVLFHPMAIVRLAVLNDDHDVALGFSVMQEQTLHYVYVGKDFRRLGIARHLVPTEINSFTHLTKIGMRLWPTKLKTAKFNPFQ